MTMSQIAGCQLEVQAINMISFINGESKTSTITTMGQVTIDVGTLEDIETKINYNKLI